MIRVPIYMDNRKEENDFNTDYTFNNFNGGLSMIKFEYENDVSIEWDEGKIFNVFRDEVLINSFAEHETPTREKAHIIADEWLADVLQDEMLDHADIYHDEESEEQYAWISY